MSDAGVFRVLFLCTGNSARSILAEAILERLGAPRYRGLSAGSHPKASPHPVALEMLADAGYSTDGLRSKSWNEFSGPSAPRIDLVITVCDNAADSAADSAAANAAGNESCPVWSGAPLTAHWSHADPAAVTGSDAEIRTAFERVHAQLMEKIEALLRLDPARFEGDDLAQRIRRIGEG